MTTLEKIENQSEQKFVNQKNANAEVPMSTYLPRTDIVDSETEVKIWAEMPGLDSNSVNIILDKNVLTLEGQLPVSLQPEGYALKISEYPVGNYRRTFRLSQEFNCEDIQAKMKNGVLCIALPKRKDIGPKRVTVKSE
jgi:HSP20 family protein